MADFEYPVRTRSEIGKRGYRISMKVLVIEDSERLRRSLEHGLRHVGFVVDLAADGEEGLAFAQVNEYDVIVLDLMLPKLDGLSLLKALRLRGDRSGILVLSAKDQIEDRVRGLRLGADDYLVKPFAFDELCARIQTLGRRQHNVVDPVIELGLISIDTAKRRATSCGETLPLTPTEYELLECLALRRGRVVSKEQLRDWLYDSASETSSNVIEAVVSTLRKKLRWAIDADLIKTQRGFGYLIE